MEKGLQRAKCESEHKVGWSFLVKGAVHEQGNGMCQEQKLKCLVNLVSYSISSLLSAAERWKRLS